MAKEKLLSKGIELVKNGAGGVDLMVERDKGNLFRVLTGSPKHSKRFWKDLAFVCKRALLEFEEGGK